MTLYHGSSAGGLRELKPFLSEHGKPYIYFSTNPVVALLYSVRPVPKPFSWYPYGFDGDTVVYSEYYPNAFADIYKGKKGFLYECDNVANTENPTNINCAYTCKKPVHIDRYTQYDDVYEQFMAFEKQGLFKVKPLSEVSDKTLSFIHSDIRKTIETYNLHTNPNSEMSRFIEKYFPEIWEQSMVISHYNTLIDENNDPVYDPQPLREYMDKWDGKAFVDELQLSKDKSVLEIGVGTGRLAIKVAPLCGRFTGVDISPKTIERAKQNLAQFSNITLICNNFMMHRFDGLFDVIYSSLTFMHIEDKLTAINKVAGLLAPGGRFVLSIDKNPSDCIDMSNRKVKIYPDNPEDICGYIKAARLKLEKQFETEFAYIFVADLHVKEK